jgi:hypothetical protein
MTKTKNINRMGFICSLSYEVGAQDQLAGSGKTSGADTGDAREEIRPRDVSGGGHVTKPGENLKKASGVRSVAGLHALAQAGRITIRKSTIRV